MAWTAPKTDWDVPDAPTKTDFNRIEENILHLSIIHWEDLEVVYPATTFTAPVYATWKYTVNTGLVTLVIPSVLDGHATSQIVEVDPVSGLWPIEITPVTRNVHAPAIVKTGSVGAIPKPGELIIGIGQATSMRFMITDASAQLGSYFVAAKKGVESQCITYYAFGASGGSYGATTTVAPTTTAAP